MDRADNLEQQLRASAITGRWWSAEPGDPTLPSHVVVRVIADQDPTFIPRAIKIRSAILIGQLDLEALEIRCPFALDGCELPEAMSLVDARAPSIALRACRMQALDASRLATRGDLDLTSARVRSGLTLHGSDIGGRVLLSAATVESPSGPALIGDGLRTRQDFMARSIGKRRAEFRGTLRLVGADIGGQAIFDGASLDGRGAESMIGDSMRVRESVFMVASEAVPFEARGELRLVGAHVGGQLSLTGATLTSPAGSALNADSVRVEQSLTCTPAEGRRFSADGEVRLTGASVAGQVSFAGAKLTNPGRIALNADDLQVDGGMFCRPAAGHRFEVEGEVRLLGARIGKQLNLRGAHLSNDGGAALTADRIQVKGSVICSESGSNPFEGSGEVRFVNGEVTGQLSFIGASLRSLSSPAFSGEGLHAGDVAFQSGDSSGLDVNGEIDLTGAAIDGHVQVRGGTLRNPEGTAFSGIALQAGQGLSLVSGSESPLVVAGAVRLDAARIAGQLVVLAAALEAPGKRAFSADGIHVSHDLIIGGSDVHPCTCDGTISLLDARIDQQLVFGGVQLQNKGQIALHADGIAVGQGMFCRVVGDQRFRAEGKVSLIGGRMSQVHFDGAELLGSDVSLAADRIVVEQNAVFGSVKGRAFTAIGDVRLVGARISGQLSFNGAVLQGSPQALALDESDIGSLWLLCGERPRGLISLVNVRARAVYDRTYPDGGTWPATALTGCTYDILEAVPPVDVDTRLALLPASAEQYVPQPYEQLAEAYRRSGHDDDARRVAIMKQKRRRKTLGVRGKAWSAFLGATVAHGYRPSQAVLWLVALLVAGSAAFTVAFDEGARPADRADLTPARAPTEVAPFQPTIYTLDLLIPVINLGQRTSWNAHGEAQWVALALTVCGWLLTAALLAGIAAARRQ